MIRIAIVGKGGTGKTAITTLLAKILMEDYKYKLLLIDADPTHPHLCKMLDLMPNKSLEEIRNKLISNASRQQYSNEEIAQKIDFRVYNSMAETEKFCLLSIGQPEGPGCFCPSNTLLRNVIESISQDFDLVLIDCEAGLEQLNRKVLRTIDMIIIVSDISMRSVETALAIQKSAKKYTRYENLGVIINKVKGNIQPIVTRLQEAGLPLYGQISEDSNITEMDMKGNPLVDIENDSLAYNEVELVVKSLLEMLKKE